MVSFEAIRVGDRATLSKTIASDDVEAFAAITGDTNPVHLDEAFARSSTFKGRVAHGILTASLISAVLGTKLPGPGTIYLQQSLRFLAPVRLGDTVVAEIEVLEKDEVRHRLKLSTRCRVGDRTVLEGEALVQVG